MYNPFMNMPMFNNMQQSPQPQQNQDVRWFEEFRQTNHYKNQIEPKIAEIVGAEFLKFKQAKGYVAAIPNPPQGY